MSMLATVLALSNITPVSHLIPSCRIPPSGSRTGLIGVILGLLLAYRRATVSPASGAFTWAFIVTI